MQLLEKFLLATGGWWYWMSFFTWDYESWVTHLQLLKQINELLAVQHMQIAFVQGRMHAGERISYRSYSKYTDLRGWFFRVW